MCGRSVARTVGAAPLQEIDIAVDEFAPQRQEFADVLAGGLLHDFAGIAPPGI